MTFEIEIGGRLRVVSVEHLGAVSPAGGRFRLAIRDMSEADAAPEIHELDARPTELGVSILYEASRRSVDAAITEQGTDLLVQLPHVNVTALVDRRRFGRDVTGDAGGSGEQAVVAPMPGRILRVLVAPGDTVEARQGLVVIEAMKMENELTAARAGRVKDVAVSEGASVEAGRVLVVIE